MKFDLFLISFNYKGVDYTAKIDPWNKVGDESDRPRYFTVIIEDYGDLAYLEHQKQKGWVTTKKYADQGMVNAVGNAITQHYRKNTLK